MVMVCLVRSGSLKWKFWDRLLAEGKWKFTRRVVSTECEAADVDCSEAVVVLAAYSLSCVNDS